MTAMNTMYEFEYMLHLAGCGARGDIPQPPQRRIDWPLLQQHAREQNVLGMVTLALSQNKDLDCPAGIRKAMRNELRKCAFHNCVRTEQVLSLLTDAKTEGIDMLLMKGISAAEAYAVPEARMSLDTDLLAQPQDECRAQDFLRSKGFSIEARDRDSCHSTCTHPTIGIVELHVDLFSNWAQKVWFQGISLRDYIPRTTQYIRIGQHDCPTLEVNAHMLFLILHMVNHLVGTGVSVGMYLDIGMFLTKHAGALCMARLREALIYAGLERAFSGILQICDECFGFSTRTLFPAQRVDSSLAALLLSDLEDGGSMGRKALITRVVTQNHNRKAKMITSGRRMQYRQLQLARYMLKARKCFFPTWSEVISANPECAQATGVQRFAWRKRHIAAEFATFASHRRIRAAVQHDSTCDRTILLRALGIL